MLAHASLYLLKYWSQYALTAWEDAISILRHAYDTVEADDRIEFIRGLDESFTEQSGIQNAAGATAERQNGISH
jgi:hypothetical protein